MHTEKKKKSNLTQFEVNRATRDSVSGKKIVCSDQVIFFQKLRYTFQTVPRSGLSGISLQQLHLE